MGRPTRVLVVDDSALTRSLLTELLDSHPDVQVIGTARDPYEARDMIAKDPPDVLTLDVEMPRMDGLAFLERIMKHHPLPVIMVSALTRGSCETSLKALELGAVDVVAKPKQKLRSGMQALREELVEKIQAASQANLARLVRNGTAKAPARRPVRPAKAVAPAPRSSKIDLIAIGASTGGTQALAAVLHMLPPTCPGIVIVQHMPERFTELFSARLNDTTCFRVKEAASGDKVEPGTVLIAPGDFHMTLSGNSGTYSVNVRGGAKVNHHRPSVDVLFQSVAHKAGRRALGAILTGMGNDGAKGMKGMRDAGAHTIAQDEASSVVFGMPKEAIKLDAAAKVLPLEQIAQGLVAALR